MNNTVVGKTMKNVRKHRDLKLVTTDKRGNRLVSGPNYYTRKYFICLLIHVCSNPHALFLSAHFFSIIDFYWLSNFD